MEPHPSLLVAGQSCQNGRAVLLLPGSAPTLSKWSIRGSLLGILAIVVGSALAGRLNMTAFGYGNMLLLILFTVALALTGYLLPRLLGISRPDGKAILFEVNVRNVNLGVLIKASIFPAAVAETAHLGNTVLLTLILFGALQLLLSPFLIWLFRRAFDAASSSSASTSSR